MSKLFVKVSGSLLASPESVSRVMDWLKEIKRKKKPKQIIICCGGGDKVNKALEQTCAEKSRNRIGCKHKCKEEEEIAHKVLSANAAHLRRYLRVENLTDIKVITPVVSIGGERCHLNGDKMVQIAHLSYKELYVITSPHLIKLKRKDFQDFPGVEVLGF